MKLTLNLSSRTYLNRRALYGLYTLLSCVLALLLVFNVAFYLRSQGDVRQIREHLAKLEKDSGGAREEGASGMTAAAYAEVLDRIDFANEILDQDSFRWTALLSQLEEVVPAKVAVSGIQPDYKERSLRLTGLARGVGDLQEFLDNLIDSPHFNQVYLLQQGRVEPGATGVGGISYSIVVREAF